MSKTAFIFPGQGAQYIGMGKTFYEQFNSSRLVFEEASDALNIDMAKLCFEENEYLNLTEYTQPAILTVSVAMLKVLEEAGIKADVTAGLSLGEYSALVANGAIDFYDAVRVVRHRGRFMQEAVEIGKGTMAAIIGLSIDEVESICKEIEGIVEPANYNCPGQIVISGETESIKKATKILKEKGARRALMLNVSAPFHSSMLKSAGDRLNEVLNGVPIYSPNVPYVANVLAECVYNSEDIMPLLIKQVYSSVKWQQSVEKMIETGVDNFIEIGPSKTLTGFMKKIDSSKNLYNIEYADNISVLEEELGGVLC